MGRGKGGSASHGKRTPGGISTSSKMSKVGEIEAQDGVLGGNTGDREAVDRLLNTTENAGGGDSPVQRELQRRVEQEMIARASDTLTRRQLGQDKDGQPLSEDEYQKVLQTPEGRRVKRVNEGLAKDYVLKSENLQKERDKQVAGMDKVSNRTPVAAPDISFLDAYNMHTDRSQKEINDKFEEEAEVFNAYVHPKEKRVHDGASESDWYENAGFIGLVYKKALKDPSMREAFLKLWSLSGELEGENTRGAYKGGLERERKVAGHLKKLWESGGSVANEDPDNLQLDAGDPLARGDKQVPAFNIQYYKILLSNPETREMLMEAENRGNFIKKNIPGNFSGSTYGLDTDDIKPEEKEQLRENISSFHNMGLRQVDNIREAVGQAPVEMPKYMKQALKGQPVSQRLYSIVDVGDFSDEDFYDILGVDSEIVSDVIGDFRLPEHMNLTDLEKYAMVEYTAHAYEGVNDYLRTISSSFDMYNDASDKDVKEAMLERIYEMTKGISKPRALATLVMRGMAKIIAARGEQPRVVTRGSEQAPGSKLAMAEGKYYYDAGVNSTSLKENWHTPWGIGGTQFVLGTNQWVDARPFSAIDRDPDATEADKEEELMVFPGTLFKIDHAQKYKSTKLGIDRKRISQDVIWGREASLDAQKGVNVMSPAGLKWEYKGDSVPIAVDLISKHVNGRRDDRAIDEYSSRFSEMGDTLYHWLYHK